MQTRFKLAYDSKALYIGVINEQPAATQVRRLSARDKDSIKRDSIQVVLDPSSQGLYGYTFEVALGGALIDGTVRPPRLFSYNWDCPWQAATTSDENYWYAEIRIPWDTMEFPIRDGERHVGIFLKREVAHLGEIWAVPAIPINSDVFLSAFNKMEVHDVNPQGRLTFYPYASVMYNNVTHKRRENLGADVFWQPSSNLFVSATINPDFGDVESDDIIVNFSNTETFLQEKRSFFVEGHDIFKTNGLTLVHTRRIGETPDKPKLVKGEKIINSPNISDILTAMKLTGQKEKLRYGFMSAFEDDNDFTIQQDTQSSYEMSVDGRKFYAARALLENSATQNGYMALGYLGTLTQTSSDDAWVHSIDGQWHSRDKRLRLETQVAASNVQGEHGYALNGKAVYNPEPNTEVWLDLDYMDDQFDINDLGYNLRNDRLKYHIEYRTHYYDLPKLKGLSWSLEGFGEANEHLLKTKIGGKIFPKFHNLTKAYAEIYYVPPAWDDLNSYGHGAYRTKEGYHIYLSWYSDESKPVHIYINPSMYSEDNGGLTKKLRVKFKFVPLDQWNIETEINYYDKKDWILWYKDNLMSGFDAGYMTFDIDSNYKLTPNQELRLGIKWVGIDAIGKMIYQIGSDGYLNDTHINAHERSFDYTQFVGQIRYKYEFAPLSDLFIVYNRGGFLRRSVDTKEDNLADLLIDSIEEKDVDQFIVKVRYRF